MKVKDMFTKSFYDSYGDVDVYDDVCEELGIAFCGLELTKAGKKKFEFVLDDEITVEEEDTVTVIISEYSEGVWQEHLTILTELFESAAGYCSESDYYKWFKELQD